jgi:2'-5' RNA ligase
MRMFVAVRPPEPVLEDLADYLEPRREAAGPLRWSPAEQWHITLAFLPAVTDRAVDVLVEQLTELAARRPAFALGLAGAGAFPNPAQAKAIWLAVTGDTEALGQLAGGSRSAAVRSGVEVSGGRFRAHLTVARAGRPVEATRWLRVLDLYRGPSWQVEEFLLVQSQLGGNGRRTVHQVWESFPLADRSGEQRAG